MLSNKKYRYFFYFAERSAQHTRFPLGECVEVRPHQFPLSCGACQDGFGVRGSSSQNAIPRRMNSLLGDSLLKLTVLTNTCTFP